MTQYIVKQLPAHLFWDSDLTKLDDVEHYEKIIIRTFERGDLDQMAIVMAFYGKNICREVLEKAAYLPERAMLFGTVFLSIPSSHYNASKVNQHHQL